MNSEEERRARPGRPQARRAAPAPAALAAQACAYLAKHGWAEVASRGEGSRWAPPPGPASAGSFVVDVPAGIAPGSHEWKWLVEQLALHLGRDMLEIAAELIDPDQDLPEVQVVLRGYRWTRLAGTNLEILTDRPVRLYARASRRR